MGGYIETNDTLQITAEQGFPKEILNLEAHQKDPITLDEVKDKIFEFKDKPKARIYQQPPTRNFLVQNINGKWVYWGQVLIIEETIRWNEEKKASFTSGKFKIIKLYDPKYQKQITLNETDEGKSYF